MIVNNPCWARVQRMPLVRLSLQTATALCTRWPFNIPTVKFRRSIVSLKSQFVRSERQYYRPKSQLPLLCLKPFYWRFLCVANLRFLLQPPLDLTSGPLINPPQLTESLWCNNSHNCSIYHAKIFFSRFQRDWISDVSNECTNHLSFSLSIFIFILRRNQWH